MIGFEKQEQQASNAHLLNHQQQDNQKMTLMRAPIMTAQQWKHDRTTGSQVSDPFSQTGALKIRHIKQSNKPRTRFDLMTVYVNRGKRANQEY